jgi:hypothetical protein
VVERRVQVRFLEEFLDLTSSFCVGPFNGFDCDVGVGFYGFSDVDLPERPVAEFLDSDVVGEEVLVHRFKFDKHFSVELSPAEFFWF